MIGDKTRLNVPYSREKHVAFLNDINNLGREHALTDIGREKNHLTTYS